MATKGTTDEGTIGYEEFDSSEFEANKLESTEADTSDTKESAADANGEGEKLTPEQAFGGKDDEEATTEEATEVEAKEASDDESTKVEESTYEPNLTYKAYGQDKEFPEQLKALVKDKDTEDYFRGLLSKADGLDEMKPRHQEAIQQRDEYKSQTEYLKSDINRVLTLRDKQPHIFAQEIGISDDWIIARAKEIVNAKEEPTRYEAFKEQRVKDFDLYTRELALQNQQRQVSTQTAGTIQQEMSTALSAPEISHLRTKFDSVHGEGAFQREVIKHGYYHYEQTKLTGNPVNLAPSEAVKQVYEFHKKTFAPAAPHVAETKAAPAPKTVIMKEKPKALPNLGKGKTVSPVKRPFKNLKEMREYVDKNVPSA